MSEGEKKAWFAAAAMTLNGLPASLLPEAVAEARKVADHPSRIVPAVLAAASESWERLKSDLRRAKWFYSLANQAPSERQLAPPSPEPGLNPDEIEEMNAIMAKAGALTRYRPDGSRYEAETSPQARQERGPLRKPTRADYIALGCSEADLDGMGIR
jgi:hypothetical protein